MYRTLAAILVMSASLAQTALSQEEQANPRESILTRDTLTGGFMGARDVLAKYGLDVALSSTGIYQHNVRGALSTSNDNGRFSGSYDLEIAADLETMLNQHAWTTFHLLQVFTPGMVQHGWGRVIVVSSPVTANPPAKMGAYAVGKAAQETLLTTLAQEVKESGVTANILQVRSIDVEGKGKGTRPDEIVAAMLYLCSDAAARITGARIPLF
uniref:SDR family oxidoreductase n=1 Tax=Anaerolinea thermolimosa TaxID=229919 RepID=A0A7C4PI95_9CHLR